MNLQKKKESTVDFVAAVPGEYSRSEESMRTRLIVLVFCVLLLTTLCFCHGEDEMTPYDNPLDHSDAESHILAPGLEGWIQAGNVAEFLDLKIGDIIDYPINISLVFLGFHDRTFIPPLG
jgi:hypothetical protein